jgi:hypothetical protein
VSVLETILTLGLTGLFWATKSLFFGGWFLAKWLLWAMSPVWVVIAALGAISGFLFGQ